MAKRTHRLTALYVEKNREVGLHPDGAGLYLKVRPTGGKSWVFRYTIGGKTRYAGLGSTNTVSLASARYEAAKMAEAVAKGNDPLDTRHEARRAKRSTARGVQTFKNCALRYLADHEAGWRNAKHCEQWRRTLEMYVYPTIGNLPICDITTEHIHSILQPIWLSKNETASRLRGRLECIIDAAKARGERDGENPARWRGHLSNLLPKYRGRVRHQPALPFAQVPEFIAELRERSGTTAQCLEFTILTAARTTEARCARWTEIDFVEKVWTVPAERMKAERAHRVALSDRAIALLRQRETLHQGEFVFPGLKPGRPLSDMAMLELARGMRGRGTISVHGFRSSFRDWASETQREHFHDAVVEAALAHVVQNRVEAAYRRGDLLDSRRALMAAWAAYCQGATHAVEEVDFGSHIRAA